MLAFVANGWLYRESSATGVEIGFLGGGGDGRELAARVLADESVASLEQIHSARVLEPHASGRIGRGDALCGNAVDLALVVKAADCVPLLIAGRGRIAAVHAGWRGIRAGMVAAVLATVGERRHDLSAWLGPAIGGCCYEVGWEVAVAVAATSSSDAVIERPARPHLDIRRAVHAQLAAGGVEDIRLVGGCTRCDDRLASYRRDGVQAGRNLGVIWRRR